MADFKIKSVDGILNGSGISAFTTVKYPKSIEVSIEDEDYSGSDNVGRNKSGTISRNKVAMKRVLKVEWGPLTGDEIKAILRAIDPSDRVITKTTTYWKKKTVKATKTGTITLTRSDGTTYNKKVKKDKSYTSYTKATKTSTTAKYSQFVQVYYPDPYDGADVVRTFYCSNRTAPLYNRTMGLWESLSIEFIER